MLLQKPTKETETASRSPSKITEASASRTGWYLESSEDLDWPKQ